MNRYKIFLITGEVVEVLAESVFITSDRYGLRFDFLKKVEPRDMAHPSAIFYCEYIKGWVEMPKSEDKK